MVSNLNDKLSLVAIKAHNAVSIYNDKTELIWVNNQFVKTYGYSLEEFIQEKGKFLKDISNNDKMSEIIDSTINKLETSIYECLFLTKSGEKKWIQTTLTPVAKDGKIIQFIAIDADLSEQKLADDRICQQQEEIHQQIEELKVQTENLSETNTNLEEHHEEIEQQSEELSQQSENLNDANEILTEQKEQLTDTIGEIKSTQSQLVQSEKMAALGQLTAGIAHELNNPINYIKAGIGAMKPLIVDLLELVDAYDQLNKEDLQEQLDEIEDFKEDIEYDELVEGVSELTKSIKSGVVKTTEIVKGLQTFSQSDLDKKELSDIHKNLDSTLLMLKNTYKYHVEIIKEYGNIPKINCFSSKLSQVFTNIISNGVQAIKKDGIITVKTFVKEKNNTTFVAISIKDNGIGMTAETKSKIFEPFFTKKEIGKGTGLGMSISYSIIEKHNGLIDINSELGKGSEFIVYIPII